MSVQERPDRDIDDPLATAHISTKSCSTIQAKET